MQTSILTRAVAGVQRFLRKRLNLNVSRYAEFQVLIEKAYRLPVEIAKVERLRTESANLQTSLEQVRCELEHAQSYQRIHEARAQLLAGTLQDSIRYQFRSLQHVLQETSVQTEQPAKGTIVVVMTSAAQITQLKALAAAPRIRQFYELVVVAYLDARLFGIVEFCESNEITLLSFDLKVLAGNVLSTGWETKGDTFTRSLDQNMSAVIETVDERNRLFELGRLASEVRRQMGIYLGAGRVVRDLDASLLILFEDNAEYETGIWTTVAQENLIPTVIIPYTIADPLEPAEGHHHDAAFWADFGIYNRLAKVATPHWLYHYKDRWLLRRMGVSIVAAEVLGVAPVLPWIHNSSKADAIAVESEAMRHHYVSQGVPQSQLRLTGSLTDDLLAMAARNRRELKAELGLDQNKPVLLCAVPPNQLTATRPDCEFKDFDAIVDFWIGELAALKDWQVLLKPHPAMRAEDVEHLRKFGLPVLTGHDTTALIPLCDLYNTSVSSTIRWALACGKPVLNYDVYKYRYQDFVAEPAVLTVFDADDFAKTLHRLTGEQQALAECVMLAEAASARWGLLDGSSTARIADLLDELVGPRNGRPPSKH